MIARAEGTYAFSHLTFQEYLAALAIAGRDDYVKYTLRRAAEAWWREVILLEAGYLSTQSKEKTTRLIRALADAKTEPEPYHNLVLAAECVRDAGANRLVGDLETELRARLQRELETPVARGMFGTVQTLFTRGMSAGTATKRRIATAEALGQIGGGQFWTMPHGEPEWVPIPEGGFTMGDSNKAHRVHLPDYAIARVPITHAQYQPFVQATGHQPPEGWNGQRPPRGREIHPVVDVRWHAALAYCRWLSEAEWEKAARGDQDQREYPWGDTFEATWCNTYESGFGDTTPVGIFLNGASPYGCLDLAGNVLEWTRSHYASYPYRAEDGRENLEAGDDVWWVLRGGSWPNHRAIARCAYRLRDRPDYRNDRTGFRVVLRSAPVR